MNSIQELINAKTANIDLNGFITGEISMDSWDTLPTAFYSNGGNRLIEIYNAAMARWSQRTQYMQK
jgi:hypothetical protein